MQVREIMTKNPVCCTTDTSLQDVARMMVEQDCGCIPVVESAESRKPVGVITDRDICCRTVAEGKNPLELKVGDIMTHNVVTATPEMTVDDCCQVMEEKLIRRVLVVDEQGGCCGIVAQADVARKSSSQKTAEVVHDVSRPTAEASRAVGD